jgi:hypothetical protein
LKFLLGLTVPRQKDRAQLGWVAAAPAVVLPAVEGWQTAMGVQGPSDPMLVARTGSQVYD